MTEVDLICQFCGSLRKNRMSKVKHEQNCKLNPNRLESNLKEFMAKGHPQSNPNPCFTSEAREKIRQQQLGKPLSQSHKKNIGVGMRKAVVEGRQRTPKPGGITTVISMTNWQGKTIYCQGSWETKLFDFLNSNRIPFSRNNIGFPYEFQGEIHRYFPDFYLDNLDAYVEVKGYETDKDKAKWSQFPHRLLIVRQTEIDNLHGWWEARGSNPE